MFESVEQRFSNLGTKRSLIGESKVDISTLECGTSREVWLDLENGGKLSGSIRVSFVIGRRVITNDVLGDPIVAARRNGFVEKYGVWNSLRIHRGDNVGALIVHVYKATGLDIDLLRRKPSSFVSKSFSRFGFLKKFQGNTGSGINTDEVFWLSVFFVFHLRVIFFFQVRLNLGKIHVETLIDPQSVDPEWNQTFTFPVKDIHDVLEISVENHFDHHHHDSKSI